MIIFIVCNALIAFLVLTQSQWLELLTTPIAQGLAILLMIISVVAGYTRKISTISWHDGFVTGGLLAWYGFWRLQFDDDMPLFWLYPLYFAALTTVLTLLLINRSADFDEDSIANLRHLERLTRFDISVLLVFVVLGLIISRHYALYPMAMTFFIFRHTIQVCLESINRSIAS